MVLPDSNADGTANSVDPDQTASFGSTLFVQMCLSKYLESIP